jgi:hypothetical protein
MAGQCRCGACRPYLRARVARGGPRNDYYGGSSPGLTIQQQAHGLAMIQGQPGVIPR